MAAAAEVAGEEAGGGDTPGDWLYADEDGADQGPFTAAQMKEWFEWDYFGKTTLVRHVTVADYYTIEELFPEGNAFLDSAWRDRLPQ